MSTGVEVVNNELVSVIRGKASLVGEEGENSQKDEGVGALQQTSIELSMHREYRIPQRPDVQIERTVWIHRSR